MPRRQFSARFCSTLPSAAIAQAPPAAAPAPAASAAATKPAHRLVEARIKSLHASLHNTTAQEPQWQAVATVMRDNAETTGALIKDRTAKAKTMTAVDDLRSYEAIADAHAAGVKKLTSAFETLYASLSDAQKKDADARSSAAGRSRRSRRSPAEPRAFAPALGVPGLALEVDPAGDRVLRPSGAIASLHSFRLVHQAAAFSVRGRRVTVVRRIG